MKKNWIYGIGAVCIAAMLAIGGIFAMPQGAPGETIVPTQGSTQSIVPTTMPDASDPETTDGTTMPTLPATEPTQPSTQPTDPSQATEPATQPPTQPTQTEAQSLKVLSWPASIARGETGVVTIQGKPNTSYTIKVYYKSGPSTSKALADQVSDADGLVTWTWKVSKNTKPGDFKIIVSGGGESVELPFSVTE